MMKFHLSLCLLSIVILETTTSSTPDAYHKVHSGSWLKRNVNRRQLDVKNDGYCNDDLCEEIPFYPHYGISDAVNRVRKILAIHDPFMNRINSRVIHFHTNPRDSTPNKDILEVDGCKVHEKNMRPLIGHSFRDGRPYYIVNIPSLQQNIRVATCDKGSVCSNSLDSPTSFCQQVYRSEEFLVLPAGKDYFHVNDFSTEMIEVPNGCECAL